jgi:hypothetical protein
VAKDSRTYGFSLTDAESLAGLIGGRAEIIPGRQPIGGGGGGGSSGGHGVIVKTPAGGIAARSGTTVSSASCDVFSIVGTTLTDTGNNIDVFNISISAVGASKYGLAKKEYATGKWVIDFEDCS